MALCCDGCIEFPISKFCLQRKLLPESEYFVGEVLPPHLSPFVDASSRRIGDYIPPEEKRLLGMEEEATAQKKKASEDEEEEEEDSEEEDESTEEEEEEEEEESEASGEEVEETDEVRIVNFLLKQFFEEDLCVLKLDFVSPTLQKRPCWLFRKRRARCRWRRAKRQ